MKKWASFLLILPLWTAAQDCKLHRDTDPYTKETKLSTGFISLRGASVTFDADSKEIDIFFAVSGNKCFNNSSTAVIFFEGTKTRLTNRNSGSLNCEGFFHIVLRNLANPNTLLQKLTTMKVSKIIFSDGAYNSKNQTTVEFTPEQQESVMNLGACLVNEAKALIK